MATLTPLPIRTEKIKNKKKKQFKECFVNFWTETLQLNILNVLFKCSEGYKLNFFHLHCVEVEAESQIQIFFVVI